MPKRKRHFGLNVLIILVVIACILAFVAHSKNWIKTEGDRVQILSGIFYEDIQISKMDSLNWVDRIPQMERKRGFSAWAVEKGIFIDSLNLDKRISVFIDNLRNRKIKMVYGDSLVVFLNFSDSVKTDVLFGQLTEQKEISKAQFLEEN